MNIPVPTFSSSSEVAKKLLEIEAIKFNFDELFTWVSGIKSPIYCDNRKIGAFVNVRDTVVSAFTNLISSEFPETEVIAAVATGGMTIGAIVADRLKLPFIYVRSEPKKYGLRKQIEGYYEPQQKVILIEDHISTGKSSANAIEALLNNDLQLLCLISIMTYGFKVAKDLYHSLNVKHKSISDLDQIIQIAIETGRINQDQKDILLTFRNSH
jgi:orotate phosphoribosyltransferase